MIAISSLSAAGWRARVTATALLYYLSAVARRLSPAACSSAPQPHLMHAVTSVVYQRGQYNALLETNRGINSQQHKAAAVKQQYAARAALFGSLMLKLIQVYRLRELHCMW